MVNGNYTDDVLLKGKDPQDLLLCYSDLQQALVDKGLQIAPERTGELIPLFGILKGYAGLTSPWSLTAEELVTLQVERGIEK